MMAMNAFPFHLRVPGAGQITLQPNVGFISHRDEPDSSSRALTRADSRLTRLDPGSDLIARSCLHQRQDSESMYLCHGTLSSRGRRKM